MNNDETNDQDATPSVRNRQFERLMHSVESFLLSTPKHRSENTRTRISRVMDTADEIRAILVKSDSRLSEDGE